jgi:hypothetical protein
MPKDYNIEYGIYEKDFVYKEILTLLESNYPMRKYDKEETGSFILRKWKNYEITATVVNRKVIDFEMVFRDTDTLFFTTLSLKIGFSSELLRTRIRKLNKVKTFLKNMDRIQSIFDKSCLFDRFLRGFGIQEIVDCDREFNILCDSQMTIIGPYEDRKRGFLFKFKHAPGISDKVISYEDMMKIETSEQFFKFMGVGNGK